MCNSSTCPNNKTGIGADFMCLCANVRVDYRSAIRQNIYRLMVVPNACNPAFAWDIIAEYYTQK